MAAAEAFESASLVDLLLEEQQQLSAVDRFAQRHADATRPLQERYYRDLIPSSLPGSGEQYAFRVDLDLCTGCKACVTACHSLNGLDDGETWRRVGALVSDCAAQPVAQTVTTTCHHCEDPACLSGCPVRAYEKDPTTGIVRHLDDQCIGCQYCVLMCPYDVPRFDAKRGIVRKCDMCSDRLSAGEAPACVQGCPNEAIAIEIVAVGDAAGERALLPMAQAQLPDSRITRPTTRYVTRREFDSPLVAADADAVAPSDPHHPLSAMLVLTQLAVGVFAIDALLALAGAPPSRARAVLGLAAAGLGLGVANLHLGRPRYAFRAVLGLATSWMSREIVALGGFGGVAALASFSVLMPETAANVAAFVGIELETLRLALSLAAAGSGALAVLCSVMIYAATRRAPWRLARTARLFFGTTLVLGLAGGVAAATLDRTASAGVISLGCLCLSAASFAKHRVERGWLRVRDVREAGDLARSRALLEGPLAQRARWRSALAWAGGVALPLLAAAALAFASAANAPAAAALAAATSIVAFALCALGEWLERHLFFVACAPRAMPGA